MATTPAPTPFYADLYHFDWSTLTVRLPLVSAASVALCVFLGILLGHPGGALTAAGGAFLIGFGANQRIGTSRALPMLLGAFASASATLIGTLAGHTGASLLLASAGSAAIYGVLTIRHAGLAWVGQQASINLFVSSAFPAGPRLAFTRTGLVLGGALIQLLFTSFALHLIPDLRQDVASLYGRRHAFFTHIRHFPTTLEQSLPAPDRRAAAVYSFRLVITVLIASELYRRLGIQSGYWIPMTALIVQKPAFFETLTRALLRVIGTLAGAYLATIIAAHLHLSNYTLAALVTFFAFSCYATIAVNYGLYAICITSYIVFLLSLNQVPGPEIAHRRAFCTMAGAAIALIIHLDALRRHRQQPTSP